MRAPIAYGLAWPERIESGAAPLDFRILAALTFEPLDAAGHAGRFPGVQVAWQARAAPPGTCAVLNAANEVAVAAFLERRIRFDQIDPVNRETLAQVLPDNPQDLAALLALDARARAAAGQIAGRLAR
jgi:1-deoxy-D-xylulose-5-phosphate reductoisomerase